ncbi:hypothetical protein C3L33_01866, partial [Rhododendron williamsianum]
MGFKRTTLGFDSMAYSSFDCAASSLLCEETNGLCFDDLDSVTETQNLGFMNDDRSKPLVDLPLLSEEIFSFLVEREREHLPREDYLKRVKSGGLDLGGLRKEALDWIWKAYAHYSFGPLSVGLSVNYLDRFLSVYELPRDQTWTVQLLAVACLSLAAKMEETMVPLNVDLQVGEPRFMFEGKTIQRMELLVMRTLNWKMKACTPFSFIDYFMAKINVDHQPPSGSLISRSVQLILSTIKGIDFLEFKPSEIAAAVALHVSGKIQAVDIPKAVSCFKHLEEGRVLKCVDMIQHLAFVTTTTTTNVGIGASVPQSPIGVLDAAACLSYKSDDLTVGSCAHSSHTTPETKRRKVDNNPSQETNFKS